MLSRPRPQPVSRRNLLKLGGAAAATGALGFRPGERFADGDPPPVKAKQPDRGGTFRIRIAQAPAHFDPHQTAASSTIVPLSFAYSRLVMIKPGSNIVPGTQPLDSDLAQSWDRVGDHRLRHPALLLSAGLLRAALSVIPRPPQLGQKPRPLHETAPAARACTPCTAGARSRAPGSRRSGSRRTLA